MMDNFNFTFNPFECGPFAGDDLEFFMKHRRPMRWIDTVLSINKNNGGVTQTNLDHQSLAFNDEQLMPSALIEIMGQSYGYIKAARARHSDFFLSQAYLAAIDSFEYINEKVVTRNCSIETTIEELYNLHPFYIIKGLTKVNGVDIAAAKLKCYASFERRTS